MRCPECGSRGFDVIDTRPTNDHVWRRRQCRRCDFRFTTREYMELADPGSRSPSRAETVEKLQGQMTRLTALVADLHTSVQAIERATHEKATWPS